MTILKTPGNLELSYPGPYIYYQNLSTVITDSQVHEVMRAIQIQLTRDFFPRWGINAQLEVWDFNRAVNQWQLIFLDDADQADALGYHSFTSMGKPLAKVFVKTAIDNGTRWSVVASHEVLEMVVDPYCELVAFNQISADSGTLIAYEVCDPVESDESGYDIGDIRVSNFVLPTWFEEGMSGPYDYLNKLIAPLQLDTNGYMSYFEVQNGGGWKQTLSERRDPDKPMTSASRLDLRATPKADR